jgi:hypothetical protein
MTNIRETLDCKNLEEQSLEEKLDKNTWQLLIMEKKGLMSHDIRVILRSSLYKVGVFTVRFGSVQTQKTNRTELH